MSQRSPYSSTAATAIKKLGVYVLPNKTVCRSPRWYHFRSQPFRVQHGETDLIAVAIELLPSTVAR